MELVIIVILVALVFEYINGFHDTANSIATVVSTKVLTPRQAIVLAASTNLSGALAGTAVARTVASGLVEPTAVTSHTVVAALVGAITWNLLTWYFGLPSSSSHALVGGLCGAALATSHGNWSVIKWIEIKTKVVHELVPASADVLKAIAGQVTTPGTNTVLVGSEAVQVVQQGDRWMMVVERAVTQKAGIYYKVIIPMFTSPTCGLIVGFLVMTLLYVLLRKWKPLTVSRVFGKAQLFSAAYMGFSHGSNDAQKTMGIIALTLVAATSAGTFDHLPAWLSWLRTPPAPPGQPQEIAVWIKVVCALTMAAGTAAGGWRIIKTLGHKMVRLKPVHGFAAETTAATVLIIAARLGMPVSTTHAITASIMGVGCAKRFSALKLGVAERIIWAWIFTLPASGSIAYVVMRAFQLAGWSA